MPMENLQTSSSAMIVDQSFNQGTLFKFSQEDQLDTIDNQISFRNVRISPEDCQWNCQLCARKSTLRIDPFQNVPKGWKHRLIVIFQILERHNKREWQHLQNDIFPYIEAHWGFFSIEGFKKVSNKRHWKLTLQDALAHNKELFESGQASLHKKGYWRLIRGEALEASLLGFDLPDFLKPESMSRQTTIHSINKIENHFHPSSTQIYVFNEDDENTLVTQAELVTSEQLPLNIRIPMDLTDNTSSIMTTTGTKIDATLAKDFEQFLLRKGLL